MSYVERHKELLSDPTPIPGPRLKVKERDWLDKKMAPVAQNPTLIKSLQLDNWLGLTNFLFPNLRWSPDYKAWGVTDDWHFSVDHYDGSYETWVTEYRPIGNETFLPVLAWLPHAADAIEAIKPKCMPDAFWVFEDYTERRCLLSEVGRARKYTKGMRWSVIPYQDLLRVLLERGTVV